MINWPYENDRPKKAKQIGKCAIVNTKSYDDLHPSIEGHVEDSTIIITVLADVLAPKGAFTLIRVRVLHRVRFLKSRSISSKVFTLGRARVRVLHPRPLFQ